MLHNVIIITSSGLAVFEKVWEYDSKRQVSEKVLFDLQIIVWNQKINIQNSL